MPKTLFDLDISRQPPSHVKDTVTVTTMLSFPFNSYFACQASVGQFRLLPQIQVNCLLIIPQTISEELDVFTVQYFVLF